MTSDNWTTVTVRSIANRRAVIAALFELGSEGVQEVNDHLVTHLRDVDAGAARSAIGASDSAATVTFEPTPRIDWSAAWKSRISAHRLGRLVVAPPWLADQYAEHERIVVEPGMAFGTGEHETTRGVIRVMQRIVRAGDVVADLGAGSAILAIAAAKLGASRVAAIEIDPDAIGNAEENVHRNGVGDCVTVIEGDAFALLGLVAPVQVIAANILSGVLIELLPAMADALRPDGTAILSGMLIEERADLERAFTGGGWMLRDQDEEGVWWTAALGRS